MTTATDPLTQYALYQAQLLRGVALGFETRALSEVDSGDRRFAEGVAEGLLIAVAALEGPAQVGPDPKPPKRIKDPSALTALHAHEGRCLICGNRPVSAHHLLSRSLGGDDVPENLVLLCGDGTRGCHGFVERHDPDVCRLLRVSLPPEQIDYLVGKKSWDWLDNRYPETVA